MGEVTYKLINMLKPLNFFNVGQIPLLYFNTPPHVWVTNEALHVHTIFNQMWMVANQDREPCFDTMLKFLYKLGIKQTCHAYNLK